MGWDSLLFVGFEIFILADTLSQDPEVLLANGVSRLVDVGVRGILVNSQGNEFGLGDFVLSFWKKMLDLAADGLC